MDTTPSSFRERLAGSVLQVEDIREFQAIIRESTGVNLNDADAWSHATELIALFRMLAGPLPEDLDV